MAGGQMPTNDALYLPFLDGQGRGKYKQRLLLRQEQFNNAEHKHIATAAWVSKAYGAVVLCCPSAEELWSQGAGLWEPGRVVALESRAMDECPILPSFTSSFYLS